MSSNTVVKNSSIGSRSIKVLGRAIYSAIALVARGIDAVFHFIADRAMDSHLNRQERLAMQVPEYADIERRRHSREDKHIILMSSEDNLGIEEVDTQAEIRQRVAPTPRWFGMARFFRNRPLTHALGVTRMASQRVTRGWDDRSLWSLDDHLCETLGGQLAKLADIAHGWPAGDKYPEYEDWTAALRKNAAMLQAYKTHWDIEIDDTLTPEQRKRKSEKVKAEAQKAIRWVAANLPYLWD